MRIDPATIPLPPIYPDNKVVRQDIARYYDNIVVMNSLVGLILHQLEADGLMDNTIIFFFSDHGAGLPWFKRELYDRGLHVPFIVRFPDQKGKGSEEEQLHSFVDLAPTVLSLANVTVPDHIEGQAFLGAGKKESREYIFAARDRMDEHYDLVRAVRDKRFKYIRNYQPDKRNYQDLEYRKQMDMMKELLRLHEGGKLNEVQGRWFTNKPVEELYDTETDPFETKNLANDPAYNEELKRLRVALNSWLRDTRDKGFMSEKDLISTMWPEGSQPVTDKPEINFKAQRKGTPGKGVVTINCTTAGASIGYKTNKDTEWKLYTQPIEVNEADTIFAKAIRYGFKTNETTKLNTN